MPQVSVVLNNLCHIFTVENNVAIKMLTKMHNTLQINMKKVNRNSYKSS